MMKDVRTIAGKLCRAFRLFPSGRVSFRSFLRVSVHGPYSGLRIESACRGLHRSVRL